MMPAKPRATASPDTRPCVWGGAMSASNGSYCANASCANATAIPPTTSTGRMLPSDGTTLSKAPAPQASTVNVASSGFRRPSWSAIAPASGIAASRNTTTATCVTLTIQSGRPRSSMIQAGRNRTTRMNVNSEYARS